jgi:hypothetical protein
MPLARLLVLAVLGVPLAGGTALAQEQAPPPPPPRAELLDLFDDIVPQLPAERVIRFKLAGGRGGTGADLAVDTDMSVRHGIRQLRLRGMEGLAEVQVGQRPRGPMGLIPFFDFTYRGPAAPTGGSLQTNVNVLAGQVRIARTHRLDDLHTTLRFNQ